jgi:PKD repeat protein
MKTIVLMFWFCLSSTVFYALTAEQNSCCSEESELPEYIFGVDLHKRTMISKQQEDDDITSTTLYETKTNSWTSVGSEYLFQRHASVVGRDDEYKTIPESIDEMFKDPEFIAIYDSLRIAINNSHRDNPTIPQIQDERPVPAILGLILAAAIWGANMEGISYLASYFLGLNEYWNGYDFTTSLITGAAVMSAGLLISLYSPGALAEVFDAATSSGQLTGYLSGIFGDWLESCMGNTSSPDNISVSQITTNMQNSSSSFNSIMEPIIQDLESYGTADITDLEPIWLDFSSQSIATSGFSVYTESMDYNTSYGYSWRMLNAQNSCLFASFNLSEVPSEAILTLTHLSSYAVDAPGYGYSPIDIYVNNNLFLENYDVALAHGGSHGYETDIWQIEGYLVTGDNTIYIHYGDNPYTQYWIQSLGVLQGQVSGEEPHLILTNNSIPSSVPNTGGIYSVTLENDGSYNLIWDVENVPPWVSVIPSGGSVADYQSVTIQIEPNTGDGRYCVIRFHNTQNNWNSEYVHITQGGAPILDIISNNIPNPIPSSGGSYNVTISNEGDNSCILHWDTMTDCTWVSLSPLSGSTQYSYNISLSFSGNQDFSNRTGYVRFYNEDNAFNYIDLHFCQNGVPAPTSDWDSFHKNCQNTGYSNTILDTDIGIEWAVQTNTSNSLVNGPVLYENKVIFAHSDGIVCYNTSGNLEWELDNGVDYGTYPAVYNGVIYASGEINSTLRLYAIDVNTGVVHDTENCFLSDSPIIADETGIYVTTEQRWIYAYSFNNGNLQTSWIFDSDDYDDFIGQLRFEESGLVAYGEYLYANGRAFDVFDNTDYDNGFYLIKIDKSTGNLASVLSYSLFHDGGNAEFRECITPVIYDNIIYYEKRYNYSSLSALHMKNLITGSSISYGDLENHAITSPVAHNDRIYFADDDGYLYCLNAHTGSEIFVERVSYQDIKRGLALCDNCVIVISESNEVILADIDTGDSVIEIDIPNSFVASNYSAPAITGNKIIFGNSNGQIICVSNEAPPIADFHGNPTSGYAPLTVQFADDSESTSPIISRTWSFGDGGTSTNQNPMHVYEEPGDYSVSLTVITAHGANTKYRDNYVSVSTTSLSIYPSTQAVSHSAGSFSIIVTSDTNWTVTDNASWISCSQTSGSNNGIITVFYSANTSSSTRTGEITFSDTGSNSQICSVIQAPGHYLATPGDVQLSASGDVLLLVWSPVTGASRYRIESSDHYSSDFSTLAYTSNTYYFGSSSSSYNEFFRIVAIDDSSSYQPCNFPEQILGEWYNDLNGVWHYSIRDIPPYRIRTGNVYYWVQDSHYNGNTYRVLTLREGTTEEYTFFFYDITATTMSANKTVGNVWEAIGIFHGLHKTED